MRRAAMILQAHGNPRIVGREPPVFTVGPTSDLTPTANQEPTATSRPSADGHTGTRSYTDSVSNAAANSFPHSHGNA